MAWITEKIPWEGTHLAARLYQASGPLVFFLHGNSSCGQVFDQQASALVEAGFGVLVMDLPGHGESGSAACPEEQYSFPGYARAAAAVLDSFGVNAVTLVGWSLGGHVVLELMGRDARVQSAMILGTPPIAPGPNVIGEAFMPSDGMSLAGKEVFSEEDAKLYGSLMLGGEEMLSANLLSAVRRTDGRARKYMLMNGLGGVGLDERALVESDRRPVAVLHGRRDPFVSLSYLQGISYRNAWKGRVVVLDDVGHAPHWQAPEEFNTLLLAWLNEIFCVTH